jgi:hypothetical protein
MAKVFIEESTLTKIGNAIRNKTGKTELIDPAVMDVEISNITTGGGSSEDFEIVLTGSNNQYAFTGPLAEYIVENYPSSVRTEDLTGLQMMFYNCSLETIPFAINIKQDVINSCRQAFYSSMRLKYIPDIDFKMTRAGTVVDIGQFFAGCSVLESAPVFTNIGTNNMTSLFSNCYSLKTISDDYFSEWRIGTGIQVGSLFTNCCSLRKIPTSLFEKVSNWNTTSASAGLYYSFAQSCYTLSEILNMPVSTATYTSNWFGNTVSKCYFLSRFTFETNEDGTPKTAKWKTQTLDLSNYVGYVYDYYTDKDKLYNYTGVTEDKVVTDDTSYQALKDDPDWHSFNVAYSKYNHDSAVETINSLPDTSAYLAEKGGTNTIKFKGAAGSATGGAINTLTEEEIAVAAAKGWTVTLV